MSTPVIAALDRTIDAELSRLERLELPTNANVSRREKLKIVTLTCITAGLFAVFAIFAWGEFESVGWLAATAPANFDRTVATLAVLLLFGAGLSYSLSLFASVGRSLVMASPHDLSTVESVCNKEPRARAVVARWMTYQPKLRRRDAQEFTLLYGLLLRREIALEALESVHRAHEQLAAAVTDSDPASAPARAVSR